MISHNASRKVAATAEVIVIVPAAVILYAAAKVTVPLRSPVKEAFAVAVRIVLLAPPADTPTATVAEPAGSKWSGATK
jgi:hypothetical protein